MNYLVLILSIITVARAQNYLVSLSFPFLIDNNRTNILYIASDFAGNFLVSLENAQGRKYDPNFSSYQNFTMPEAASFLAAESLTISGFTALDGSSLTSKAEMVTSLANSQTTVRDYAYASLALLQSFAVGDPINYNFLLPLNISNHSQAFHLFFCQNSLSIGFAGNVTSFPSFYAAGEQNFGAKLKSRSFSVSSNVLKATVVAYLTQSGNRVYQASVTVALQYDPAANSFSFVGVQNQSMVLLMTTSFQGTSLLLSNSLLLIQNPALGGTALFNTATNTPGSVGGFSSQVLVFFFIFGKYYALQRTGLALLSFNSGSNALTVFSLSIPLLSNNYGLSPGNANVDPFYIVGQPYVYKAGTCTGQSLLSLGGICVSYSCLIPNCNSCPFTPLTCGVCDAGYYKSSLLLCAKESTSSSANSSSGSTAASNGTQPASENNQTNSANSSAPQDHVNGTSAATQTVVIYFVSEAAWETILAFLKQLLAIIQALITVPGARKAITPFFYYFGVFDDLYLYQFHDRVYGATMNAVLNKVNDIENSKWTVFTYDNVIERLGGDPAEFDNLADYQAQYLAYNWTDANHTQLGTESLLGNSQNFFVVAIPFGFLLFALCRTAFRLLYRYPLSKLFRKFDFWLFLPIVLFEGNIEQFSFFLTRDLANVFAFSFSQKLVKAAVVLFGFAVVVFSCSVYLLSYIAYRRLNAYFMDNNRNSLVGIGILIFQNGLRNLLLGALQALLRPLPYETALSILLISEFFFLLSFLFCTSRQQFKQQLKIWIYVLINLIKAILLITFYFDYGNENIPIIEAIQQVILFMLLLVFILGFTWEAGTQIVELKQFIAKYYCTCSKDQSIQDVVKYFLNTSQVPQIQEESQKAQRNRKQARVSTNSQTTAAVTTMINFLSTINLGKMNTKRKKPEVNSKKRSRIKRQHQVGQRLVRKSIFSTINKPANPNHQMIRLENQDQ